MEVFQAAFLGIVQGLTEFLPVSSSGHLIVLPKIFGWGGVVDSLEFDVAVHLGSILAVIGFFWKDWIRLFSAFFKSLFGDGKKVLEDPSSKLLILIAVGSIPAAIVGLLFKDFIEKSVRSTLLVGTTLIVFAILLWLADKAAEKRKVADIGWKDAIFIGIAQAVSLIPGVSRSGITITAARSQKLDREAAVRFSFLLSTPAIVGAGLLTVRDYLGSGFTDDQSIILVGFIFAAIFGWLAIKFLLDFVRNYGFTIFVVYRILLGIFLIIWSVAN